MSTPNWWGDWRPILTPHTGNLQPTDLLECTSIVGGLPVNTSITGAQIIAAASGGGATWGSITGTLSAQTDLNTALSGKQDTLVSGTSIKTVNNNSLLGSGNLNIGPRLLGFSGINGTNTTSNAVTICHSLMIPANTLTTNSILQLVFRMNRVSGNTGQMYGRIYFNTSNSLTGASLLNTIFQMNGGGVQFLGYVERNFSYDGTNLVTYQNNAYSEYTTGSALSIPFNRTVNNWVLFTMQAQNAAEIANINLFKVFAYV
jgi:hypothetical protein